MSFKTILTPVEIKNMEYLKGKGIAEIKFLNEHFVLYFTSGETYAFQEKNLI